MDDSFVEGLSDVVEGFEGSESDLMFSVVEALEDGVDDDEREFRDSFWEVIDAVDDEGHDFESCYFLIDIERGQIFLSKELYNFIDLSDMFSISILGDDDFDIFAGVLSFLLVSMVMRKLYLSFRFL